MDKQLQIPAEVRTFLEGLLSDAGMTSLDEGMKEEMIKELYVRLDNFITASLIDKLPPEHLEAFIKMNEEKKPQAEIEQFLKQNLPNYGEVLANTFIQFRENYLGNVAVKRAAPPSAVTN